MSFLAPLFLVALGALAIPLIVHLIQRERKQVVEFPSLMFLRRIPYQSVRRRRIRHWPLLLLRLAALALIVAAFARPFFRRADAAASGTAGPREVVVLLDQSHSMGYGDRWTRARTAARDAIAGLDPADRASVILFSTDAELAVRSAADRASVLAAIDGATLHPAGTRFAPALKLAQGVLAESKLSRREVVLVSDFQRRGWSSDEAVRFPAGTIVRPVVVGDEETANLAVTSASFQRSRFSGQERVAITAAVVNRSDRAREAVAVALEIDGRVIQTTSTSIEANASASVAFPPVTLTDAFTRGTVRLPADALEADNAFHFVLSPGRPVAVLMAERSNAARESSVYVTRALGIGTDPRFEVTVRSAESTTADDLTDRAVVIWNDAALTAPAVRVLRRHVEEGGGLLVALGERTMVGADALDLLPVTLGATVDRTRGAGGALGALDYSHPIFEPFKAPRSGDFSAARFFRYRAVTPRESSHVLARFDDGAAALVEGTLGQGRVLVWTSTLDTFWNDLALRPVFLPFVHRVARHLADHRDVPAWFTVGQVLDPAADRVIPPGGSSWVALTPSGSRTRVGTGDGPALVELVEQGFYEFRTDEAAERRPATVAVNLDVAESDLTSMDAQELVAAVSGRDAGTPAGEDPEALSLTPVEAERRQRIWWYLLLAGVGILAAETVVSSRLTGKRV